MDTSILPLQEVVPESELTPIPHGPPKGYALRADNPEATARALVHEGAIAARVIGILAVLIALRYGLEQAKLVSLVNAFLGLSCVLIGFLVSVYLSRAARRNRSRFAVWIALHLAGAMLFVEVAVVVSFLVNGALAK